uniref:Nuclear receptor domain-containing protein n=1 Tax=Meloidogyne hapla TaxID=6305 RepID=A0A1I8BH28_MELHA
METMNINEKLKEQQICVVCGDESYGARNMCRSCRYEKCLREGMLTSSVQNQNEQTSSNQGNFLPLLPSESGIGNKRLVNNHHQFSQFTHLHRMMEGYQQFKSLRKAGQAMIGCFSISALSGDNLPRSHIDNYIKMRKISRQIGDFPLMFCNAERAFQTYLKFGPGEDMLIMPDGGYVRLSEFHLFFKDSKQVTSEPEQIARVFHNAIQYLIVNVVPHMRNIEMKEEEMVTLMGMFLWNDSIEISEQSLNISMKVRNEIIVDLHKYYRGIGLNEEGISNVVKMMQENAAITNLFNMAVDEKLLVM